MSEANHDTGQIADFGAASDWGTDPKVSEDVAEQEIDRFLEAMDIDADKSSMDDEDLDGYKRGRRTLAKAMMDGSLVINDAGEPVFTPKSGGDAITFHEPTGATYMEMDRRKQGHDVSKMISIMAAQSKQPPARFANMPQRDFRVAQAITILFMG